jgi:hypothetical protein
MSQVEINPDNLFAASASGETFFYTIKGNLFTGISGNEMHGSMLDYDPNLFYECFPNSKDCFLNKDERHFLISTFWGKFLKNKEEKDFVKIGGLDCRKTDMVEDKLKKYLFKNGITYKKMMDSNASVYPRYKAMMFGNILGRFGVFKNEPYITLWNKKESIEPNLLKKFLNDAELFEQLLIYFKKYPSSEWKVVFEKNDFYNFNDLSNFKHEPKSVKKSVSKELMPDQEIKILDKVFTISQLQTMRSNMHVKSNIPDPTIDLHPSQYFHYLCSIDDKKYPKLSGYRPSNCPSNNKGTVKYEPTVTDIMRKEMGYPYYKKYEESFSFKNWFNSINKYNN